MQKNTNVGRKTKTNIQFGSGAFYMSSGQKTGPILGLYERPSMRHKMILFDPPLSVAPTWRSDQRIVPRKNLVVAQDGIVSAVWPR